MCSVHFYATHDTLSVRCPDSDILTLAWLGKLINQVSGSAC